MKPSSRFTDQIVFITGAASGIGRATAAAFAAEGARVHLADIDPAVEAVAAALGPTARGHLLDVTDARAVADLAERLWAEKGRVDVVFNNAGVCLGKPVDQLTLEDWRWILDINLWGVIHGVQAFAPRMVARGSGVIVNTASMAGLVPLPGVVPYCASKFAVFGLSESLGAELAGSGVHVLTVCPGAVRTRILENSRLALPGKSRAVIERLLERLAMPPERLARQILDAVARRAPLLLAGGAMTPLDVLQRSSRGLYGRLARRLGALARRL